MKAYNENGFDFLLKVFNVPKYLEDCTGLTKLQESTLETEVKAVYSIIFSLVKPGKSSHFAIGHSITRTEHTYLYRIFTYVFVVRILFSDW